MKRVLAIVSVGVLSMTAVAVSQPAALLLVPSGDNSRNSEGDFIQLEGGRILFVYTHFSAGKGSDFDSAHLASRESRDGGATWTGEDVIVIPNEGAMNTMSVSLERLTDGRIALLYLRKNGRDDCRPYVRFSDDEAETWSEPYPVAHRVGYYVINNDRLVQLNNGRLVAPAAIHAEDGAQFTGRGRAVCFLSDDGGKTWRRSATVLDPPEGMASGFQEPGVVELADDSLLMLIRTSGGFLYESRSTDEGDTWSAAKPTTLASPVAPATVEQIPGTERLLLVWNDHESIPEELKGKRTPLTAAVSNDGGRTWMVTDTLEDDPDGWYCYTAMEFVGDHVLLGYCAGNRKETNGLAVTKVTRVPLAEVAP